MNFALSKELRLWMLPLAGVSDPELGPLFSRFSSRNCRLRESQVDTRFDLRKERREFVVELTTVGFRKLNS